MAELPEWLDPRSASDVVALFRRHGVAGAISILPTNPADEVVFLVTSTEALGAQETALTIALQARLGWKVWIITDASAWPDTPILMSRV